MDDSLYPGQKIGSFRLEAVIGEGASSCVYRASNGSRIVALKMLKVHSRALRINLERECRVLSSLSSPNIVGCEGIIEENGQLGIVLEYVAGPSLSALLAEGPVPLPVATAFGEQIIRGVAEAHAAGLVHRDIKPSNVLTVGGQAKLGDFGLVFDQSTDGSSPSFSSGVLGTARYIAPEQLREIPQVDHRSDLYSLGLVLYELVCGMPAFRGDRLSVLLSSARGDFVRPRTRVPAISEAVDRAIVAALEPDPDQRVPDAGTLLRLWHGEMVSWERPFAPPYLAELGDDIQPMPQFLARPVPRSTHGGREPIADRPGATSLRSPARFSSLVVGAIGLLLSMPAGFILTVGIGWWLFGPSQVEARDRTVLDEPASAPSTPASAVPPAAPAPSGPIEQDPPGSAGPVDAPVALEPSEPRAVVQPTPRVAEHDATPEGASAPEVPVPVPARSVDPPLLGGQSDLKSPWRNR